MKNSSKQRYYHKDKEVNRYYITDSEGSLLNTIDLSRPDSLTYIYYRKTSKVINNSIEVGKEEFSIILKEKVNGLRNHTLKYHEKTYYKDSKKSYIKTKVKWDIPQEVVVLKPNELSSPKEIPWKEKLENFKTSVVSGYNKIVDYIEDLD